MTVESQNRNERVHEEMFKTLWLGANKNNNNTEKKWVSLRNLREVAYVIPR